MKNLQWNDTFCVGIKLIDEQHRQLISLMNKICESMAPGTSCQDCIKLIEDLEHYTVLHFRTEEELLKEYNYPKFREQKAEHSGFIERVFKLKTTMNSDLLLLVKTVDFLKEWMIDHILGSDMEYSEYLKSKGVQ